MNILINEAKYLINGIWYKRSGWFGCQLMSVESKLPEYQPRKILDEDFEVHSVTKKGFLFFKKYEIYWRLKSLNGKNIAESNIIIRKFYENFNGI